jgi:ribonuclease D
VWAQRDPIAAARLDRARTALKDLSEQVAVPVENLLTPDLVRRLMWQPPEGAGALAAALSAAGARPWQVELTAGLLEDALASPA